MTPKEKAEELVNKMYNVDYFDDYDIPYISYKYAKQCALIAVDYVLNYCHAEHIEYWQKVKQEIELL